MTIGDAWETKNDYSALASSRFSQLAFIGLGLVWFLVEKGDQRLYAFLIWPALIITLSIAIDFSQYVYATRAWHSFARSKEEELGVGSKETFDVPVEIPRRINRLFIAKIVLVVLGYVLLLGYATTQLA